jgi:hypothetical protein
MCGESFVCGDVDNQHNAATHGVWSGVNSAEPGSIPPITTTLASASIPNEIMKFANNISINPRRYDVSIFMNWPANKELS